MHQVWHQSNNNKIAKYFVQLRLLGLFFANSYTKYLFLVKGQTFLDNKLSQWSFGRLKYTAPEIELVNYMMPL